MPRAMLSLALVLPHRFVCAHGGTDACALGVRYGIKAHIMGTSLLYLPHPAPRYSQGRNFNVPRLLGLKHRERNPDWENCAIAINRCVHRQSCLQPHQVGRIRT